MPKSLRRRKTTQKTPGFTPPTTGGRLGDELAGEHARHTAGIFSSLPITSQREKMNFAVVLLPLASWHQPLPYPREYRAMIEEFCEPTTCG